MIINNICIRISISPQSRKENKEHLDQMDGVDGLLSIMGVDWKSGLLPQQVVEMRSKFGMNQFPETPMTPFYILVFEALSDLTLLVLLAAATGIHF